MFNFFKSREEYDNKFHELPEGDRNRLEGKMVALHGCKREFQEASDGKSVDEGLLREHLKSMQSHLKAFLIKIADEKNIEEKAAKIEEQKKAAEIEVQKILFENEEVFLKHFDGLGARVFELFQIAKSVKTEFDSALKEICSFVMPNSNLEKTFVPCELKGLRRSLEKAIVDYCKEKDEQGGLHKVLDIVK